MIINAGFGKMFCSLRSPTALLVLPRTLCKRSFNVNLESRMTWRCLWYVWVIVLLLIIRGEWYTLFVFLLQITSWTCLLKSGLKLMFHWKTQVLNYRQTIIYVSPWGHILSLVWVNKDVSSAKNLAFPPVKSFVYCNLCTSQKGYYHTTDTFLNLILLSRNWN